MKLFLLASILCLFSLKSSAQCPVFLSDDTAIFEDDTAIWVFDETSECDEIEVKYPLCIFPNPTTDYFEVRNWVNTEGYIFDLQGRQIRKVDVSTIINVSDLPCAMYIIRVDSEIRKFIKIN